MVVYRHQQSGHVVALAGGQIRKEVESHARNVADKYAKFAYSNAFGFSLSFDRDGLVVGAFDSTLALSPDGRDYRIRAATEEVRVADGVHYSRWQPWPHVEVETWLIPVVPWHVRIHRVTTPRALYFAEGGFALGTIDEVALPDATVCHEDDSSAFVQNPLGFSGIRALHGHGQGKLVDAAANTNLIAPLTRIPMLVGEIEEGTHVLACAVLGVPGEGTHRETWNRAPGFSTTDGKLYVMDGAGRTVYASAPTEWHGH
jgi:hypothetical protein